MLTLTLPPNPQSPGEIMRWEETRRRRRLLDGTWRTDLERRLVDHLGTTRRQAWGALALSINPFRNICRELAVLYDAPPEVRHADEAAAGIVAEVLRLSSAWGLMQRVQAYAIGCREYLVRADLDPKGRVCLRPVAPDLVEAEPKDGEPDRIGSMREWRLRRTPTGDKAWFADALDMTAPEPIYAILDAKGNDVSAIFGVDGWPSAWRYADGAPALPYVVYHAQRTGDRLWEPYEGIELVEASLDLAVLHMMMVHTFRDASWPQRWAVDVEVEGGTLHDGTTGPRTEVVTDPASLLMLRRRADTESQPMIGQWQPGGDVATMEEVISNLVARVAQDAGVPPSDVQRLGGTARSGVAISLTNEGKRAAQRRYASTFRTSDEELAALVAVLVSRSSGASLPESGYEVIYREVPLSPEELRARREHALTMLEAGLMSRAEAYRETHPGISEAEAERAIARLAVPEPGAGT